MHPPIKYAEKAVTLNPNDPEVLCMAGQVTQYSGKSERGAALARKAMALGPNYPTWCHVVTSTYHYFKREYEQALAEALKVDMPEQYWTHFHLAINYAQLGRKEEARAAVGRLLKLYPDFAANYRREAVKYNFPDDWTERCIDGLRKAGLDVPAK